MSSFASSRSGSRSDAPTRAVRPTGPSSALVGVVVGEEEVRRGRAHPTPTDPEEVRGHRPFEVNDETVDLTDLTATPASSGRRQSRRTTVTPAFSGRGRARATTATRASCTRRCQEQAPPARPRETGALFSRLRLARRRISAVPSCGDYQGPPWYLRGDGITSLISASCALLRLRPQARRVRQPMAPSRLYAARCQRRLHAGAHLRDDSRLPRPRRTARPRRPPRDRSGRPARAWWLRADAGAGSCCAPRPGRCRPPFDRA